MRNQLVEVASFKKPGRASTIKDPLDVYVGRRLRRRRLALGISQSSLGESVGVSFQQVQKYESGANRAVVRRLYDFARTLNVSPGYFFEGYGESMRCAMPLPSRKSKRRLLYLTRQRKHLCLCVLIATSNPHLFVKRSFG